MEGERPPQAFTAPSGPFNPSTSRRLTSWIDAFIDYTDPFPSPQIYKTWGAISIVAGALEQKVWLTPKMGPLYPHLYTILVGPPGVGKSIVTSLAKALWTELEDQFVSADAVSRASFMDELREADRKILIPTASPPMVQFHSMKVSVDELGVLLPEYERELISAITHLYDVKPYAERKRTKDLNYKLLRPQLNILGGCTPSYLKDTLPETAWDQGFASRFLFIYSGESFLRELFSEEEESASRNVVYSSLVHDLKLIGKMFGRMTFEKDALELFTNWHLEGGQPKPDHPKLINYNQRRSQHLLKLCMVASADRGTDLKIVAEDLKRAFDWLVHAEHYMPDIFKAMSMGGDQRLIAEIYHFTREIWLKKKQPVPKKYLVAFIAERAPAHAVHNILKVMVDAGILLLTVENIIGDCYAPRARKPT